MRFYTLLILTCLLTCTPIYAANPSFWGEVGFTVLRDQAKQDPTGEIEQKIADLFQNRMGNAAEVKVSMDAKRGKISITVTSTDAKTALSFKKATAGALILKEEAPIRLVYKNVRVRRQEHSVREKTSVQDREWEGNWQKAWEKSMERMEQKLNRTLRTGLHRALGHLERVAEKLEEQEPFGDEESIAHRKSRKTSHRRKSRNRQAAPLRRGAFQLSVNKESKVITRLIAYDAELGAIMTNLAAQIPLNYIFSQANLPRQRVTLSLVECNAKDLVDALAASAGIKVRRQGSIVYFEAK